MAIDKEKSFSEDPIEWLKNKAGGVADTILELPDKYSKTELQAKIARIVFSLIVTMVAAGICTLMIYANGGIKALADPSLTSMMSMPMMVMVSGIAVSWLIEDISALFGREAQRSVAKIIGVITPLLAIAGAGCLVAACFKTGLVVHSINLWFFAGLLVIPFVGYAAATSIGIVNNQQNCFMGRANQEDRRERRRLHEYLLNGLNKEEQFELENMNQLNRNHEDERQNSNEFINHSNTLYFQDDDPN